MYIGITCAVELIEFPEKLKNTFTCKVIKLIAKVKSSVDID